MKLNLGSGTRRIKGYKNVDLVKMKGVDIVHDLEVVPYPFKDNSVDEIYARSVCEHIHNFDTFMQECHRILRPGGILRIHVPYYNCSSAIRPDHVRFFNFNWFLYWTENSNDIQSKLKPKYYVLRHEPVYGKIGRLLPFLLDFRIGLSKVFGEVIEGVDTELMPVTEVRG